MTPQDLTEKTEAKENTSGVTNPLWFSVSETAKLGGVTSKTIRRAIQAKSIRYKLVKDRYFIEFSSAIAFLNSSIKLRNKFNQYGFGQYVDKWQENNETEISNQGIDS